LDVRNKLLQPTTYLTLTLTLTLIGCQEQAPPANYVANATISEIFGAIMQLDENASGRVPTEQFLYEFKDIRSPIRSGLIEAFQVGEGKLSDIGEIEAHLNDSMLFKLIRASAVCLDNEGNEFKNQVSLDYARENLEHATLKTDVYELAVGDLLRSTVKEIDAIKGAKAAAKERDRLRRTALKEAGKAAAEEQRLLIEEHEKEMRVSKRKRNTDGEGIASLALSLILTLTLTLTRLRRHGIRP